MSLSNYIIPLALFVLFAHPATFKVVRGVAGNWVASPEGSGKLFGLIMHGLLFVLLTGFLMRRVSFYSELHPSAAKDDMHMRAKLGDSSTGQAEF
jgi:hypothetical protein